MKDEDLGPCLIWDGPNDGKAGYGSFVWRNRKKYIHRVIWEATDGPIPEGMVVRHRCDNPACYRRSHLELGTQKENVADSISKGRFGRNRSQYPPDVVAMIRADTRSSRMLGEVMGMPHGTIRAIRRRRPDQC